MSIIPQCRCKDYDQDLALIMRALAYALGGSRTAYPLELRDELLGRAEHLNPTCPVTGGDTHISASRGRRYS